MKEITDPDTTEARGFSYLHIHAMHQLTPRQLATLRDWFVPERAGPLVGLHVIQTGNGACFVDRWPDPRAVLVEAGGNYALAGDPQALHPADLQLRIAGFVEAPERFVPVLRAAFPDLRVWDRVIFDLAGKPRCLPLRTRATRRLEPADAIHLWGLSPDLHWIWNTWGGLAGFAASGCVWGAFVQGRLVAVACSFFQGECYEDIGVVTEPEFRGRGFSVTCAGALCEDIQSRGRRPSWTTSPDNVASVRVAQKLGFSLQRHDVLYAIGVPIPAPVTRSSSPMRQPQ